MAVFGMVVMLGPAVGPTLGGYIVDHFHWSWIFFINIPIGGVGLLMVASFVHEDAQILAQNRALAERERRDVDWIGIALLSIGLSTLEYVLEEGQRYDWFDSATISICVLVSIASLASFVARELTAPAPVVNLRLFRDPVFASGTIIGGLMFAMLMANMFLLPLFMQELLGFTATQSGLALVPRVLVMMVVTPIVGRIYNHVSPRLLIGFGILAFAFGSYALSHLTLQSGWKDILVGIMVQGVGFGCLFVPLTTVALSRIPRNRMADATGMNSLVRQIGGAIGLAMFATLLERYTDQSRVALVAEVPQASPSTESALRGIEQVLGGAGATGRKMAITALDGIVQTQASVLAFERIFLLAGVVFLVVLPLLFLLETDRDSGTAPGDAHMEV